MSGLSITPSSELFTSGQLGATYHRPVGRLGDRRAVVANAVPLPVLPENFRSSPINASTLRVESRTDQRVRSDAPPASSTPGDVLRRAQALGVLKEVQDTAASLVFDLDHHTEEENDHDSHVNRKARRYLALKLAESCLEHGEDDEDIHQWLNVAQEDVRSARASRQRLPGIQQALRELESSPDGAVVLGTFNASLAAEGVADGARIVDTYLELAHRERTFGQRLLLLVERHPLGDLLATVRQLLVALRQDLEAALPSRDPVWLSTILQDIGHMHLSSTLVEQLQSLQVFLTESPPRLVRQAVNLKGLLSRLVALIDQGSVMPSQIDDLARFAHATEPSTRIQLLVGLRRVLMALPDRTFASPQQQVMMVGCVQHCLDTEVGREEAQADASGSPP